MRDDLAMLADLAGEARAVEAEARAECADDVDPDLDECWCDDGEGRCPRHVQRTRWWSR